MSELKPCPFCGGESLLRERYINGAANTKHYIRECRHCKATFANWYRSIKKANEAWNRRAQPDNEPLTLEQSTNADRIRGMSDEEMAVWLVGATVCERVCDEDEYCHGNECVERVTRWLKQPAKEEHNEID